MDRHFTDPHTEANALGDLRPDTDAPSPNTTLRAQSLQIGVLAFGSLIDNPGSELRNATVDQVRVTTPFRVEFARQSSRRGGAPTLIPVERGGAVVPAKVLVLDKAVSVFSAADMLYRREINKAGTDLRYDPKPTRERDDIVVELLKDFGSCDLVLYTKIGANIEPLTASQLADLAIASAKKEAVAANKRDGISYLISAKDNAITTPLSPEYVAAILAKTILRIWSQPGPRAGRPLANLSREVELAQVAEASIKAGLTRIVGRVRVDPGMLRAEAGPFEPRLVVPVSIEMHNRPADQMLALLSLTGFLHVDNPNNPATQVGYPANVSLLGGFPARSLPEGSMSHLVDLRFQLSLAGVHRLELARHSSPDGEFVIHLRLQGPLAWLRTTQGEARPSAGRAGNVIPDDPFRMQLGLHSELSLMWTTEIDHLRIPIDPTVWIKNVLPGFGIENVRLIEVVFPPGLPDVGSAAKIFDDAQRAYLAKRYEDCISKCRGIIRAWNKQLNATSKQHLAELVGNTQGWPTDDPRRGLLDSIWQALLEAGNVAHHPENRSLSYEPDANDARLHLMLTAIISEYLHQVLR